VPLFLTRSSQEELSSPPSLPAAPSYPPFPLPLIPHPPPSLLSPPHATYNAPLPPRGSTPNVPARTASVFWGWFVFVAFNVTSRLLPELLRFILGTLAHMLIGLSSLSPLPAVLMALRPILHAWPASFWFLIVSGKRPDAIFRLLSFSS